MGLSTALFFHKAILTLRLGSYVDQRPGLKPRDTQVNNDPPRADLENWFGYAVGLSVAKQDWVADIGLSWERGNGVGTGKETFVFDSVDVTNVTLRAGWTWYFSLTPPLGRPML